MQNALYDIVDFCECRGARLLLLATPLVDDLPEDKRGAWGQGFVGLRTSCAMTKYQDSGTLVVDGVRLKSMAKLLRTYPDVQRALNVDLEYMVDDNEPSTEFVDGLCCMADASGYGLHIDNGCRRTPAGGDARTVYCFGDSIMYGYMVVDQQTLPWKLQELLPSMNVVNAAVLGDLLPDIARRLATVPVRAGDVVVVQQPLTVLNRVTSRWPLPIVHADVNVDEPFVDVAHLTPAAHERIARQLAAMITDVCTTRGLSVEDKQLVSRLVERCTVRSNGNVGATVMSCNPFTLGHEWLCRTGSALFDEFLVFIMQDDLECVFAQADAEQLVKVAVEQFDNVYVVSMNGLFGYNEFWPEYIMKTETNKNVLRGIDTRRLLRCVASAFNQLNVRWFVCGDESTDVITAQHVDSAQRVFAAHGVRTLVLPRKTLNNVTCATSLRDQVLAGDYQLLPAVCADYLREHDVKPVYGSRHKLVKKLARSMTGRHKVTVLTFDKVIDKLTHRLDDKWRRG